MRAAAQSLAERYRTMTPDGLRMVVWYGGDEHEVVYVRDDVAETYSPEELEENVKQLVVEGLSDPPTQEQFRLFGETNTVIREFEHATVLHFPVDEFTGVAVTFDNEVASSLDTLSEVGLDVLDEAERQ
jgi:hypothetical protein